MYAGEISAPDNLNGNQQARKRTITGEEGGHRERGRIGRRMEVEPEVQPESRRYRALLVEINYSMNISFGSFECKQSSDRVMYYTVARSRVDWDFGRSFAHPCAPCSAIFPSTSRVILVHKAERC